MGLRTVTIFGVLVAILPFVTIPSSYKTPAYVFFGIVVAYISYRDRHSKKRTHGNIQRRKKPVGPITPISPETGDKNYATENEKKVQ